jgi:signal transduction histidine kinase
MPATADQFGQLFLAMAEELKLPLQYIARQAELQSLPMPQPAANRQECLQQIQTSADLTLQLLDSYLLSLRLSLQPASQLDMEPVSVSAVLQATAHQLRAVARQYGVTIEVHIQGRYEPVVAHRQALQAALIALGYAVIEALPAAHGGKAVQHMQLATHRTKQGIVAGIYGDLAALTPGSLARAKQLHGHVRQPMVESMAGSAAGIFVADALLGAMSSRLRVGRFNKTPGFAVTLPALEQMQLV